MLVRIMIFNQSFKTVVDAYDALLETRAKSTDEWEGVVCVLSSIVILYRYLEHLA